MLFLNNAVTVPCHHIILVIFIPHDPFATFVLLFVIFRDLCINNLGTPYGFLLAVFRFVNLLSAVVDSSLRYILHTYYALC